MKTGGGLSRCSTTTAACEALNPPGRKEMVRDILRRYPNLVMNSRWYGPITIAATLVAALGGGWIGGDTWMVLGGVVLVAAIVWAAIPDCQKRWSWFPGAYRFPDSLSCKVGNPDGSPPLVRFHLSLSVTNPGHDDVWDARVVEVEAADGPTQPIEYLRWMGENNEKRTIKKGDTARLELGWWNPLGEGLWEEDEPWKPGELTVRSSTGEVPLFLPRDEIERTDEIAAAEIVFLLRLLSDETGNQAKYRIRVGASTTEDYTPEVEIERVQ